MDTQTETNTETETRPVGRPRSLSDRQVARAVEMYESGKSVNSISKNVVVFGGASPATIRLALKREGVEMRGRGRQGMSEEQVDRAVELQAEGLTLAQLREHPDLSNGKRKKFAIPTISKALKARGVELSPGRPAQPKAEDDAPEADAAAE